MTNPKCPTDTSGCLVLVYRLMDGIILFNEPSQNEGEDLPWARDWIKSSPIADQPQEVFDCYLGDKGLLIITGEFKMFLFRKQSEFNFLVEALEIWVKTAEPVFPVIALKVGKKIALGLNQKAPKVIWNRDESKFYSRRADDTPTLKNTLKTNPFLSPTTPHDESTKNQSGASKPRK